MPPPFPSLYRPSSTLTREQAPLDTSLAVSEIVLPPHLLASPPPGEGHVSLDTTLATLSEDILSTTLDTSLAVSEIVLPPHLASSGHVSLDTTLATTREDSILDTSLATNPLDSERGELRLPPHLLTRFLHTLTNLMFRDEHVSLATSFAKEEEDWVMEGLDAAEGISLANCTLAD